MSKFLSKPEYKNQSGRNGFDISQSKLFSANPGQLLPYYTDFANAGDKYKITPSAFIRTEAIKTAAMMRLNIHLEGYFVPFRQMYMFWNEVYNQVQDIHTNLVPSNSIFKLPCVSCTDIFHDGYYESSTYSVDYLATSDSEYMYYNVDPFGVPYLYNFRRLFDLLDYGVFNSGITSNRRYNIFKYLAYHKIFYSFYNNSLFFKNDASYYNIDKYYADVEISGGPIKRIMSTIHYRPWRVDEFTNIFPTPTYSNSYANYLEPAVEATLPLVSPEKLASKSASTFKNNFYSSYKDGGINSLYLTPSSTGPVQISATDIRSLFAFDKLARITGSAGSHYDKQTLAHLGYKIPDGLNGECYRVGSYSFPLVISDVVATASTSAQGVGSVIGDVAGKGFASGSEPPTFDFTAPESGVLMLIFSIEPLADYKSFDTVNTYQNFYDFYHPEFDNLGLEPLYEHQLTGMYGFGNLDIIGWRYRYTPLKSKYNVVSESIYATDKTIWQGNRQDSNLYTDMNLVNGISLSSLFFINPQYCNNIFAMEVPYYTNPSSEKLKKTALKFADRAAENLLHDETLEPSHVYSSDNFIVRTNTKCYKTSIMSVHSLPKLF